MQLKCILALIGLVMGNGKLIAQSVSQPVWVVQFDPTLKLSAEEALSERFERKRVKLWIKSEDTLNLLHKFIEIEDPILEIDCFIPELKIIYSGYTYIISAHCGKVLKYKNRAPFQPSSVPLATDFLFTPTSLQYFRRFQEKLFKTSFQNYFEQLEKTLPSARTLFLKERPNYPVAKVINSDKQSAEPSPYPIIDVATLVNYDFKKDEESDTVYQRIEEQNQELFQQDRVTFFDFADDFGPPTQKENFFTRFVKKFKSIFKPKNRFIHYRR
jgi:hypothetical protein